MIKYDKLLYSKYLSGRERETEGDRERQRDREIERGRDGKAWIFNIIFK